jgi:RNA polymerase sigma factor (sigma-70 family)
MNTSKPSFKADGLAAAMTDHQLIALLQRVAEQDANALRQLYDATSSRMYAVAMRVVGNTEYAEDILQDAYLNIWRIAGDFKASLSPPMAWMGLIVRSRALDFLRRRSSEKHLSASTMSIDGVATDEETPALALLSDEADPMDASEASEQALALHQCLSRIEAKPRAVLVMAYFKDLSHGELAEQLKLPLGTVKTWIRRSLEQLRACMSRYA